MSSYKSFAIVGFGGLGSLILREFIKQEQVSSPGHKLRVLTRKGTSKPELTAYAERGVEIKGVDYSSSESIEGALKGVDVVVSTLRDDGLEHQTKIIHAAKAAGVKLFVPSEFGINSLGTKEEYIKIKSEAHDVLKKLSLPYSLFFIGFIPEPFLKNALGTSDFSTGKFELFDEGNTPISWTSSTSIATYVHHAITTFPESTLKNKVFRIEGDRKTWREIIAIWEAKHKKQAQVHCMTQEELREFQARQTMLLAVFASNVLRQKEAVVGGDDNALWPGWNPLKWENLMI